MCYAELQPSDIPSGEQVPSISGFTIAQYQLFLESQRLNRERIEKVLELVKSKCPSCRELMVMLEIDVSSSILFESKVAHEIMKMLSK